MEAFANNLGTATFFVMLAFTIVSCTYLYYWGQRNKEQAQVSEKMQELRNEELRLRIQLRQLEKEKTGGALAVDLPRPKEPSREEAVDIGYEMGYQQQSD
jgi:hypothetical protein